MKKIATLILFTLITLMGFSQATYTDKMIIVQRSWGDYVIDGLNRTVEINSPDSVITGDRIFYVDAVNGSDTNNGLTASTAFKTLNRIDTTFTAGDIVALKRNQSHEGAITVNSSGTSVNGITYTSYGLGSKPKIYGSEVVTGWTLHSGNIYKAEVTATDISQLFLDGERMKLARYPNTSYHYISTVTNDTVFTSTDLNSGTDYTDATIVMRVDRYTFKNTTISTSTGQELTMSSTLTAGSGSTTRAENDGFFLADKLDFLDQAGEWYYDRATDTLYIWTEASDSPTNYEVRASIYDRLVDVDTNDYITFRNLDFRHAAKEAIWAGSGSTNNTVNNCVFIDNDIAAINMINYGNSNWDVQNNTITGSGSGVMALGDSWIVSHNTFSNIGQFENIGKNTHLYDSGGTIIGSTRFGTGIFSRGDNPTFEYNDLTNIGYTGIGFQGLNSTVRYNYINGANQVLDDGAGIYVVSKSTDKNLYTDGSLISYNIVLNSLGQRDGYFDNLGNSFESSGGIYLDFEPTGVTVDNNVVWGATYPFFITGGADNSFRNNIIGNGGLIMRYDVDSATPNYFKSNNLYATDSLYNFWYAATVPSYQRLMAPDENGEAYVNDSNIYVRPYGGSAIFKGSTDFADWKIDTGEDANSTYIGDSITVGYTEELLYNNTTSTKIFYNNSDSIYNVIDAFERDTVVFPLAMQPYTGKVVQGVGVDYIVDYEDITAPVITAFSLPDSASSVTVTVGSIEGSGSPVAYTITETSAKPSLRTTTTWQSLNNMDWVFSGSGNITAYLWLVDAAGNISASASDSVFISNPLKDDLLIAQDFEETSTPFTDDSEYGSHSVSNDGTFTFEVAGNPGTAVTFNGSDARVRYADSDTLSIAQNAFTVEMWLKPSVVSGNKYINKKGNEYAIEQVGDDLQVTIWENGLTTNYLRTFVGANLSTTEWSHIVVTYDGSLAREGIKVYKNTTELTNNYSGNATITNVANTTGTFFIGGSGSYYTGDMSVFRAWPKELTTDDIDYLYDGGSGILTSEF